MDRKFTLLSLILTLVTFSAFAGVKVTSLDLATQGQNGYVKVKLEGRSPELPDLKVYGNTIEIVLSGAEPFNAISTTIRGAQLSANVLNGKAIIKAILPYKVEKDGVDLSWKTSNIEVIFPRGVATAAATVEKAPAAPTVVKERAPKIDIAAVTKKPSQVSKDALNEDYLNKLMKENVAKNDEDKEKVEPQDRIRKDAVAKDEVNLKQAAPEVKTVVTPAKKDEFSFAGYALKFTVFLAMVLGLFYGVVQILKKGVFNRGKLGFLNNHQMIEVLSTTYVSPKKSLMIVKAHKQLFLVANSENGLQFLSEMKDTSGIIKAGEKAVTGANFDMNLADLAANAEAPGFTIKEDIMQSTPVPEEQGLAKIAKARDIVKFSDELKKKAKKLRPIEFN